MVCFSNVSFICVWFLFEFARYCRGYYLEISKPELTAETCADDCVKKVSLSSNNVGANRSCSRGCRFFEIAQLIYIGNSSLNGCFSYCEESYKESEVDLISCKTGCSTPKPRLPIDVPLIAEISWSFFIESGDASEPEDIFVDPSYKDQFANFEDFKLPEMKMRSIPIKHDGVGGGTWKGVPHCLVASLLLLLVILALLLGLLVEESSDTLRKDDLSHNQAPPLPEKLPIA